MATYMTRYRSNAETFEGRSEIRAIYQSPIGPIWLVSDREALTGLYTPEHRKTISWRTQYRELHSLESSRCDDSIIQIAVRELEEYFDGRRKSFSIPTRLDGTDFQRMVWESLREIPYGEMVSYGALASRLGRSQAARAVGAANGQNPISIIYPCHRVIGSQGDMTGYAGGIACKRWLLQLEQKTADQLPLNLDDRQLIIGGWAS